MTLLPLLRAGSWPPLGEWHRPVGLPAIGPIALLIRAMSLPEGQALGIRFRRLNPIPRSDRPVRAALLYTTATEGFQSSRGWDAIADGFVNS